MNKNVISAFRELHYSLYSVVRQAGANSSEHKNDENMYLHKFDEIAIMIYWLRIEILIPTRDSLTKYV